MAKGIRIFEMRIRDVFLFADGRTVLSGKVISGPDYIPRCKGELFLDGIKKQEFELEEEMLPLGKELKKMRAVSTLKKLDVGIEHIRSGVCVLRGKICSGK